MKAGKIAVLTALALSTSVAAVMAASIVGTKHDLTDGSGAGTGPYTASPTTQVCVFCHTPHNARRNVPLWNRTVTGSPTFKFYTSSNTFADKGNVATTFNAASVSLYCMSCHDGTQALGGNVVHNPTGDWTATDVANGGTITADLITGNANIGTDLTNDHPVNFYIADATAAGVNKSFTANKGWSVTAGKAKYPLFTYVGSANGYFECASCHAVHDNSHNYFLRTTNTGSKLCLACHEK